MKEIQLWETLVLCLLLRILDEFVAELITILCKEISYRKLLLFWFAILVVVVVVKLNKTRKCSKNTSITDTFACCSVKVAQQWLNDILEKSFGFDR